MSKKTTKNPGINPPNAVFKMENRGKRQGGKNFFKTYLRLWEIHGRTMSGTTWVGQQLVQVMLEQHWKKMVHYWLAGRIVRLGVREMDLRPKLIVEVSAQRQFWNRILLIA